jgi:hypothetical protein
MPGGGLALSLRASKLASPLLATVAALGLLCTRAGTSAQAGVSDTLTLNSSHPFTVRLVATNQHNGNVQGIGQAIPQSDLFGYFSLPSLTGEPTNPEVFVKILDGTTINGQYWVFYGHLTDLIYDITVTEVATGLTKTYHKDAGNSAGGFDTSGFAPTPTPNSATPTPTPPPGAKQTITINVKAWDFNPGGPVSDSAVLIVGTTYRLVFHNVDGPLTENARHGFTGIPELGLPGTDDISRGGPDFVIDNITLQPSQRGFYPFSCTNNNCGGDPQQHASMNGLIIVQ